MRVLAFVLAWAAAAQGPSPTVTPGGTLTPGGPAVERPLRGGESDTLVITAGAGELLELVAEEKGVKILISVSSPGGDKLGEVLADGGTAFDQLLVVILTKAAGEHRIEIKGRSKDVIAGKYTLKWKVQRAATAVDRARVNAETAYQAGKRVSASGTAGSQRQAIEHYLEAVRRWREAGDREEEANATHDAGFAYERLGEWTKALEHYHLAIATYRDVKDYLSLGMALENAGRVYKALGEVQKVLDYYQDALAAFREAKAALRIGISLHNIALVHAESAENPQALELFDQALKLSRETNNPPLESNALTGICRVYDQMGDKEKALGYCQQAITIARARKDALWEAVALNIVGQLYESQGEGQQALDTLQRALELFRSLNDRRGQGVAINNLGLTYHGLGEPERALAHYQQALPLLQAVGDARREAYALHNLGMISNARGEPAKALEYLTKALPSSQRARDRRMEGQIEDGLGAVYLTSGEPTKALEHFDRALPILRDAGDRRSEAATLANIGKVHGRQGDREKALVFHAQALALRRTVNDRRGQAATLYEMALLERASGKQELARTHVAEALDISETVRERVASQGLRSSLLASVADYYALDIDLLTQGGRSREAFETSERSRARSLLESLAESRANMKKGVNPELLAMDRSLRQQIDAREQLRSGRKLTAIQITTAETEIRDLTARYQEVETRIRVESPRYASFAWPQPLKLAEVQALLDADTRLLQYSLGPEASHLWVVSRNDLVHVLLPKRDEIERAARQFHEAVSVDGAAGSAPPAWAQAARALSELILKPAGGKLGSGRLVVVADGALHLVPFAALSDPDAGSDRPLIARHELVSLPSASSLTFLRQAPADRPAPRQLMALFADPVFSGTDTRVGRSAATAPAIPARETALTRAVEGSRIAGNSGISGIPRLPGTRREAAAIAALLAPADRQQALDFDANLDMVSGAKLSGYRWIHFATHGILHSRHPELSGLIFSLVDQEGRPRDGYLRLNDIHELELSADMVVLSACQTGLGQEVRGEGLLGVTRGFLYAGAKRVVASLWKVDDRATAELMKAFYEGMLKKNLPPAAALRAAQVTMLKQAPWRSPYYWAAFVLQGEWN